MICSTKKDVSSTDGDIPTAFLFHRINPEGIFLCVGMACFFAWINMLFCFEGILRDHVAYGGGVVHDPVLLGATISTSLFLLLIRAFSLTRIWLAVVLGSLAALAATLLSWFITEGSLFVVLSSALAGIIVGYCIARLTLAWGQAVSGLDMRRIFIPICTAFYVQWIPLIPIASLGVIPRVFISVILPLVSVLCLMRLQTDRQVEGSEPSNDLDHRWLAQSEDSERETIRAMVRIALALVFFSCVFQFVWTFNIVGSKDPLDSEFFWIVFTCVAGITALTMVGFILIVNQAKAYRVELLYRAAFVFGTIGVCSLSLLESYAVLSYIISYIAYALVIPAAWMLAWSVVFMGRISPRCAFGSIFSMQYLGFFFGFLAAKSCESLDFYFLPVLVLVTTTIVSLTYSIVLPERTILSLSPRSLGLSHDSIDARCQDIAKHKGLTKRETEVLSMLARGRDVSWIEGKLFISRNTVNTHRKNIYKKLDVHTQQELLSQVEEIMN